MSTIAGIGRALSALFDRVATLTYLVLARIGFRFTFYYLYSLQVEHQPVPHRPQRQDVVCLPDPSSSADETAIAAHIGGARAGKIAFSARPSYIPRIKATWYADGALIYDLMVMKEKRGHGVGRSLISAAVEANAGTKLYAMVFATNMPSRRLFEGCGFRIESRIFYIEVLGKALRNTGSLKYLKAER